MEKKNVYISEYDAAIYRFGRVTTIIFLFILACVPVSMALIWNIKIEFLTTFKAFFTPFAMFLVVGTVEVFTMAPVLGPGGTFMSFNNGNTLNMTMPAAVNAVKISGFEPGTRKAEIVSLIGISTSIVVSKVIVFIGMLGIIVILPILESPVLQPAFENFMPALLGALVLPIFKKDPKTASVPVAAAAMITLIFGYSVIEGIEPLIMPFFLALTVGWKYMQYKKAKSKKEAAASGSTSDQK
jgi:hypothetical protein